MIVRSLVLVSSAFMVACGSLAERPAVIASPSASSRAELARVATLAFDGVPVMLADSAFTHESVVSIDRRTPAGPQGRVATGLTLGEPARLHLVLRGARCELAREGDTRRFPLRNVSCVPIEGLP